MAKSPSVQFIERDLSTYTTTSSDTVLAVVGYATKGPIGTPTKVTSFKDFKTVFGGMSSVPFSYMAVQKAFQQGNQLIYTRVAETEGTLAASAARRIVNNVSAFVPGKVDLNRSKDVTVGTISYVNSRLYGLTLSSVSETPTMLVASPASGGWALDNVLSQLQGELAATKGFQEFSRTSLDNKSLTSFYFGFQVSRNGSNIFSNASANQNIILNITATDTMNSAITKINSAFANGTRGYQYQSILTAPLTMPAGTYGFNITVNGGTTTTVSFTTTSSTTTHAALVSAIDTALVASAVGARCYLESGNAVFISMAGNGGATSTILVADPPSGNSVLDQFTGGQMEAAVPGQDGFGAGYATSILAEQNEYTAKIRITSQTTGATSAIAIDAPSTGIAPNITTVFGAANVAHAGRASVDASISVARDSTSRKIVFYNDIGTAAPVLAAFTADDTSSLLSILPVGTSTVGSEAVTADETDKVIIDSFELGSGNNDISVIKTAVVNPLTGTTSYTIEVYYGVELKESFAGLSLTIADDNFFEDVINQDVESGGSEWIHITTIDTDGDGSITFPDGTYLLGTSSSSTDQAYDDTHTEIGTYDYKVGTDGIPDTGGEDLFLAALASDGELANAELYNYHILITPDNITQVVQDASIALAESRKDFIYLVDPPFGLTATRVKQWANGEYIRSAAVSSSYAAVYWSWLKEYDAENEIYIWCPPSVFMAAKLIQVDNNYAPWYAPAGDTRGILVAQDLEYSPSFAQREDIYGDLNCVNPIVKFPTKGIEVYGQKTALRANSALNRLNVRRMVIVIKKLVESALSGMLFEPHNADSWQKATNLCNAILEPIRQDNGLSEYLVVIDSTTNTTDIIAQNIMSGIIKLVPTGTIEVIEINLNVYKSGATLS